MEFMSILILCASMHLAVGTTTVVVPTSSPTESMSASSTPTTSSSMGSSTMSMENTATATSSVEYATPTPTLSSSSTSASTSASVNPNACSGSNPACDKAECCENNAVKTGNITFTREMCVNNVYMNMTSCNNICTKQGCSHAAGLVLQIATVLMSFVIYWTTM